jgi:regulator of CtrA degradation
MAHTSTINPRIIDGLYCEALVLSDEVRATFSLSGPLSGRSTFAEAEEDLSRIALSCEALRTTTRMMHAIAWLLNRRAYFSGELSEFQLHRQGRLSAVPSRSDPEQAAMLDPRICDLIAATERFYERLLRLDSGWRDSQPQVPPGAIARMRERLARGATQ